MFKINKQGEYGLILMLFLAERYFDNEWVSLRDVAHDKEIPYRFLTQIVRRLKNSHLVIAREGVAGGYRLYKPPATITVGDVLRCLLGDIEVVSCMSGTRECCLPRMSNCWMLRQFWIRFQKTLDHLLDEVSLGEILDDAQK